MVKRCKKSGRREAVAFPLEPARRARRRATADRRRAATGLAVAHIARVEGLGVQRIPRIIAEMPASRETDPPAGFVPLQIARISEAMNVARERDLEAMDRFIGHSAATIASRENLTARRSRPEMAPQQLEKIESAPGNGMVSEASKPQDMVPGRAADRALRLTKGWDGSGGARETFPACKPLKSLKMELESADRSVRAASLEADVRSALPAARPRPPGDARRRRPWLAAAGATNRQAIQPRRLSRAAAPLAPTHAAPGLEPSPVEARKGDRKRRLSFEVARCKTEIGARAGRARIPSLLVAQVAEFDGVGGYSLPPCGGGLGWGDSRTLSNKRPILQMDIAARPPSLALPHKGGGDPLRPIKFTDATN